MQDVTVGKLMSSPALTIHVNERLDKALHLFQSNQISILPVTNTNGCCVGVITLRDIVEKQNVLIAQCRQQGCLIEEQAETEAPSNDVSLTYFGDIAVYEGMSDPFVSVHQDCTVSDCIELLLDRHIHHLPVIDENERLVGVVSAVDLLGYARTRLGKNDGLGKSDDLSTV